MSEVSITVSGPVGSGKSALLGEIEIMLKALGVPYRFADPAGARSEKNLTHADWTAELERTDPRVVLVETSPRPEAATPKRDSLQTVRDRFEAWFRVAYPLFREDRDTTLKHSLWTCWQVANGSSGPSQP